MTRAPRMATWKVAAALAAGCAVVLKPSEYTPLTTLLLADIARRVGLPRGVLNVVPGLGAPTGAAIASHAGVDKVVFTGSVGTGRRILGICADGLRGATMELGGKSAAIVFDDADVDKVRAIAQGHVPRRVSTMGWGVGGVCVRMP